MSEQKKLEAIITIYCFAEDIQKEYELTDSEMVEILEEVREGF